MKPPHISIEGGAAAYLFAGSEGAFLGATVTLVAMQEFSIFVPIGAILGTIAGVFFARRYVESRSQ